MPGTHRGNHDAADLRPSPVRSGRPRLRVPKGDHLVALSTLLPLLALRALPALLLLLALPALPVLSWDDAQAGAWTQAQGKYYARLSANRYFADRNYDAAGDTQPFSSHGEFTDLNLAGYFEYGVTSRFTALTSLSYKSLRDHDDAGESKGWGVGDVDLAVRGKIAEGSAGVVAAQFLVKTPAAYDVDSDLPLGNGQADYEARFLYGRSLWQLFPGYGNLEIGYRWRDGAPSDEVRYLVEMGSDLGPRLYARGKLDGIRSRKNGQALDTSGNPTARNNYDLGKLDLVLGCKVSPRWSIEAGFAPSIYGRTTAEGSTVSAAISHVNR